MFPSYRNGTVCAKLRRWNLKNYRKELWFNIPASRNKVPIAKLLKEPLQAL